MEPDSGQLSTYYVSEFEAKPAMFTMTTLCYCGSILIGQDPGSERGPGHRHR